MKRAKKVMVVCDCKYCVYFEREIYYTGRLFRQKHVFFKCKELSLHWKWDDFFNVYDYCPLPEYDKQNKNGKEMIIDEI